MVRMSGIQYLIDERGTTVAVQIDIRKRPELWADIQDAMESKERLRGPFEPIEALHSRLVRAAKKPARSLRSASMKP
jgi:hypothetical protein